MCRLIVPSMKDFVKSGALAASGLLETATKSSWSRCLVPLYRDLFSINMEEALLKEEEYSSLAAFFTRKLKEGMRPFDKDPGVLVSPVDAKLSFYKVSEDAEFLVKGKTYSLRDLFKERREYEPYLDGHLLIFYLSPKDYHRIHMPLCAKEKRNYSLGSFSYPVNSWGLRYGKDVLTKNYRIVSHFEGETSFTMVSVGALNVNSITRLEAGNVSYNKMQEYGYFSFGSTVLLFLEKDSVDFLVEGGSVKAGRSIARLRF